MLFVRNFLRPMLILFSLAFLVAKPASAQITNVTADQTPPIPGAGHDYVQFLNETVNPATGSVNIRIALPVRPGRGMTVPFAFTYDSNAALHMGGNIAWSDNHAYLSVGGWTYQMPRIVNQTPQIKWQQTPNDPPYTCGFSNNFVFTDLQGRSHSLAMAVFQDATPPPGGCTYPLNAPTTIGTGGDDYVQSVATTSGAYGQPYHVWPLRVADEDGTVYYFSGSHTHYPPNGNENLPDWIEDRNGNTIFINDTSSTGAFSITDTLGTALLTSTGFGTSGNTLSVAGIANPYVVTWGTSSYDLSLYKVTTTDSLTSNTCLGGTQSSPVTFPEITAIKLPNGQTYKFEYYDGTNGLLKKITYPTGGYILYVWDINRSSDVLEFTPDNAGSFTCTTVYDSPALKQRFVSFDGSANYALEQDFGNYTTNLVPDGMLCGNCQKWTYKTVNVVTTDRVAQTSFETDYVYSPVSVNNQPFSGASAVRNGSLQWAPTQPLYFPVEQTVTYKGAGGGMLRTSTKGWFDQYLLACELQTLDDGSISGTFYSYSVPGGVITHKREYDFGQISSTAVCQNGPTVPSATPFRETVTSYKSFAATPIFPSAPSIYDRPSTLVINDPTGIPFAETDYSYDENSVLCAGSPNCFTATGHDASYSVSYNNRGNATTVRKRCLKGCSTDAARTYIYDETGHVVSMTDPCGNSSCSDMVGSNHVTKYSFGDNYSWCGGAAPTGATNAYVTMITDALGHSQSFCYGYDDGQLRGFRDESNNLTTSYTYNSPPLGCSSDGLDRLTSATSPDGGSTTYCYNDTPSSPTVTTTKAINAAQSIVAVSVKDGVGHTTQTQLSDTNQGTIYTDTAYDGLGRVYSVSNPHRAAGDGTSTPGTTTYGYDALGRKTSETYPDGSILQTKYCGPNTLVINPTGRWRRSRKNAVGFLLEVDEPNAVGLTPNPCANSGDPVWITSYTPDTLGNLTRVLQNASRQRSFTYDSLSRLLCANNPESSGTTTPCPAYGSTTFPTGTLQYTYDANGNVQTKRDARSIVTTYSYDVTNRELTRSYSDGTPTVTLAYDQGNCLGLSTCQNIGRRTSMTDAAGGEAWAYHVDNSNGDSTRRNIHIAQRTTASGSNNVTKTSTYYFDLAGNLNHIVYPSGRPLDYTYDNANRPSTARDASNGLAYVSGFQTPPGGSGCPSNGVCYTPQGTWYGLSIGQNSPFTGLNIVHTYNSRLQPLQFQASSSGGNAMDISYSYSDPANNNKNAGHVFQITNNLNGNRTQSFNYDQLNRIISAGTSATTGAYCWGYQYAYDNSPIGSGGAWGNLTAQAAWTPNYNGCSQTVMAPVNVDANNHISAFSYDPAGNVLGDGTYGYSWDAESQLKSAAGVNYLYDGDGRRVSKVGGKLYWYGADGEILAETDGSGNFLDEYVYFAGRRIALISYSH